MKFWKHHVNASAKGLTQSYLQAVLQSRRQWNSRMSRPWWPVCHVSNIDTHTEKTWSPNVSKITQVSSLILSHVQEEWSVYGKLFPKMLFFLFFLYCNITATPPAVATVTSPTGGWMYKGTSSTDTKVWWAGKYGCQRWSNQRNEWRESSTLSASKLLNNECSLYIQRQKKLE